MSALEQRLHDLGRDLAFPPEPELAPRARARAHGKPFPWRAVAVAFAVLAVAVAVAFAVPPARSAILRFFHLGGASVELVDTLPKAQERPAAGGLGRPVPLSQAGKQVGFELLLPALDRRPERAYVIGNSVASVLLRSHGKTVLLSEFPTFGGEEVLKKLAANGTFVEPARVGGASALWIEGAPHVLTWMDRDSGYRERPILVRGNVLLWLRSGLTLRLEGRLSKAQALELARSIR